MAGDEQDSAGKYGMGGHHGSSNKGSYVPTIFKILELLLTIVCIGLVDEPTNNSRARVFITQRTVSIAYATFGTYLIFSAVYIIGKVVRDNWPWKTSALLSFVAVVLFVACGATLLKDWVQAKDRNLWPPNTQRLDLLCACGFMSLTTAIVFLVDCAVTVRLGLRGRLDD